MKHLLAYLYGFILVLFFMLSILYFPLFYFLWGFSNRKKINPLIPMALIVISVIFSFQNYRIFLSGYTLRIDWLRPIENPLLIYGALTVLLFLGSRGSLYRKRLKAMNNYLFGAFYLIAHIILLLVPIILIHYLKYIKTGLFAAAEVLTLEVPILMWILIVYYLFVKYSEDGLIEVMINFKNTLQRWSGDEKR